MITYSNNTHTRVARCFVNSIVGIAIWAPTRDVSDIFFYLVFWSFRFFREAIILLLVLKGCEEDSICKVQPIKK